MIDVRLAGAALLAARGTLAASPSMQAREWGDPLVSGIRRRPSSSRPIVIADPTPRAK
jgi:hypothetical protein